MEHHDDQPGMDLPPGFRFHPTDEELITHYLAKKATDARFAARAIGEADLNKSEPWELPSRAKMGEKEWYFFCVKDRKYPTGLRTNRATVAGYWKATGKDKEIFRGKALVGMRKTLVFYMGRAPKGEKTNWVMHEYRLDGNFSTAYRLPEVAAKSDWVLCRVFKKSPDAVAVGKRGAAGTARPGPPITDDDIASCLLPPLMDVSGAGAAAAEPAHVTCFSEGQFLNVPPFLSSTHPNDSTDHLFAGMQYAQQQGAGGGGLVQLLESNGYDLITSKQLSNGERERLSASQDTGLTSDMNPEISSSGDLRQQLDHEALWGYIDQI